MTFFQENVLEEAERGGAFFGLRPLFWPSRPSLALCHPGGWEGKGGAGGMGGSARWPVSVVPGLLSGKRGLKSWFWSLLGVLLRGGSWASLCLVEFSCDIMGRCASGSRRMDWSSLRAKAQGFGIQSFFF